MIFRIPILSIQDVAVGVEYHPDVLALKKWLKETIKEERTNWDIQGIGYDMRFDLERRWYPIFIFRNRWLADAFIRHLAETIYSKRRIKSGHKQKR
jgi:hypothetical protein